MSAVVTPKPPREVVVAAIGQCGSICAGFLLYALLQPTPSLLGRVLAWVLTAMLLYFLFRALLRGVNWVRWLLLVLIVLGMLALPSRLSQPQELWQKALYIVQAIVQAGATALLFLPASRRWFSQGKPA